MLYHDRMDVGDRTLLAFPVAYLLKDNGAWHTP